MGAGDPTELVQELVDSDHRLPGEKEAEGSELVEDAEHWWRVYLELLSFKRTLLSTAEVHKDDASEAVVEEVTRDERLLSAELDRLNRRFKFWEDRLRSLREHFRS